MICVATTRIMERRLRFSMERNASLLSHHADVDAPHLNGNIQEDHEIFADFILSVIRSLKRRKL